jgi:hypothetical protein
MSSPKSSISPAHLFPSRGLLNFSLSQFLKFPITLTLPGNRGKFPLFLYSLPTPCSHHPNIPLHPLLRFTSTATPSQSLPTLQYFHPHPLLKTSSQPPRTTFPSKNLRKKFGLVLGGRKYFLSVECPKPANSRH